MDLEAALGAELAEAKLASDGFGVFLRGSSVRRCEASQGREEGLLPMKYQ
jgi:hypothetical protein